MRVSGRVSIYWAAIFEVGSCECLSFASIPYAVWWVDGCWVVYEELSLMRGRKGELEGGRDGEEIFICTYV